MAAIILSLRRLVNNFPQLWRWRKADHAIIAVVVRRITKTVLALTARQGILDQVVNVVKGDVVDGALDFEEAGWFAF
jgi:hypothetical protein